MAIYLSNLKGIAPTIDIKDSVLSGKTQIDYFPSVEYRTAKYLIVVEDLTLHRIFNLRFTVTHDSIGVWVTGFDEVPITGLDVTFEAEYSDASKTNVIVYGNFPNNCKISLERLLFTNNEPTILIDGAGGPGEDIFPSDYLYPQG